jgi:hypothetical protein
VIQPAGSPGERIGTAELHVALEQALSRRSGTKRRVSGLKRRPSIYSTSFVIDELDARLDDGTSLRLLYKDLSRFSVLEAALEVKPAFLYDPMREIETYRTILEASQLGTATCYGAIVDAGAGHYGLFLEKVAGQEFYQVGDFATWRRVSAWLAAMHARFAGMTGRVARAAPLLRYDGDFYRLWAGRARSSLDRAGLRLSRDACRDMEQLYED